MKVMRGQSIGHPGKVFQIEQPMQRPWGRSVPSKLQVQQVGKTGWRGKSKRHIVGDDRKEVRTWGKPHQPYWLFESLWFFIVNKMARESPDME